MTASIQRLSGSDAYDLLFPDHLAKLSPVDQATMYQAMLASSRVWLGTDGGRVLCVWGLVPPTLLSDVAYLWMYETEHLREHVFMLIRHSQRVIVDILREYPTLIGHCRVDATKSIRWLRWLGAEFGTPIGTFVPFTIRAPNDLA